MSIEIDKKNSPQINEYEQLKISTVKLLSFALLRAFFIDNFDLIFEIPIRL